MNNEKNIAPKKNGLNKKYLKIGSFSIAMTVVVIAVVVVVNLFVGELPSTYTKYDMSALDLYSIGAESQAIINSVDEDVTFYLVAQRGNENATIKELLDRYAALNSHITVKTADPVTNPTFIEQYTTESLSQNSVIAVSGRRSYAVDYNEIYTRTYSEEELYYYYYYGQMPTGTPYFNGELCFTTALDYVTRDDLPKAYTLTGHGETSLSDTYLSYITTENIETESLSILALDKLPEDASAVIINIPTSDISFDEAQKLMTYMDEGGNVILITGALTFNSSKMPNLASVAKKAGLESVDGIVIETAKNNYMMYQHYLLPNLGPTSQEPLSLLSNGNIYVLANAAHGIIADGSTNVTPLLATTSNAYVKADLSSESLEKADGDIEGMVYIGAAVTLESDGTRNDSCKFVWYSSPALSDETADSWVSGGNSSVFMATIGWMCENKINLSIMAKQMQVEALTVTAAQSAVWSVIVVFIIPLAVFALGFVVWLRRRKA
ncbi:MAG: Gldg family protein [Eubacteriales bacterium]